MAGARAGGLAATNVYLFVPGAIPARLHLHVTQPQLNKNLAQLKMNVILLPHLDRIDAGSAD